MRSCDDWVFILLDWLQSQTMGWLTINLPETSPDLTNMYVCVVTAHKSIHVFIVKGFLLCWGTLSLFFSLACVHSKWFGVINLPLSLSYLNLAWCKLHCRCYIRDVYDSVHGELFKNYNVALKSAFPVLHKLLPFIALPHPENSCHHHRSGSSAFKTSISHQVPELYLWFHLILDSTVGVYILGTTHCNKGLRSCVGGCVCA